MLETWLPTSAFGHPECSETFNKSLFVYFNLPNCSGLVEMLKIGSAGWSARELERSLYSYHSLVNLMTKSQVPSAIGTNSTLRGLMILLEAVWITTYIASPNLAGSIALIPHSCISAIAFQAEQSCEEITLPESRNSSSICVV